MKRTLFFLLLLVPIHGYSQDTGRWDDVRELRRGRKVRIVDIDFKKSGGKVIEVTESGLLIKSGGRQFTMPRERVAMVSASQGSTGKRILAGILAGALLGLTAWAHIDRCERHGCYDSSGFWHDGSGKGLSRKSAYIVTGAGAGALGIFSIFAREGDKVIYFHNPIRMDPAPPLPEAAGSEPAAPLDNPNVQGSAVQISRIPMTRDSSQILRAIYFPK